MVTARQRALLVLLLMCAVVGAQAASFVAAQTHEHSQHCCGLCHVGSLPFVQSEVSSAFVPVLSVAWMEQSCAFDFTHDVLFVIGHSRAPPA